MSEPSPVQTVVVAGDVTADWYSIAVPPVQSPQDGTPDLRPNWQQSAGTRFVVRPGGALLLADLVAAATGRPVLTHARDAAAEPNLASGCLHSHADLALFPVRRKEPKADKVYRVLRWGGFSSPPQGLPKPPPVENDDASAGIVVLNDAGNGFRDTPEAWPAAIRDPNAKPWVVLKMHAPLFQGNLWEHLVKHHGERLIVVLRPDDLRTVGVDLGRVFPRERTAIEFVRQISSRPTLAGLTGCAHLLVMFGLDGAIDCQPGALSPATLHYDPASSDDGYARGFPGWMVGCTSAFVAGVVSGLVAGDALANGISRGLHAARRLLRQGFGADPSQFAQTVASLFGADESGEARFVPVDIPADDKALADRELLAQVREQLGRAVHKQFLDNQRGKRAADAPEMQPWEQLREHLKESNRQQADDIPNKLRAIGCGFEPVPEGKEPEPFTFTDDELKAMARLEHERWNQERLSAGWRLGPSKDAEAKITPYLVPFDELSPEVQEWDLDAVRAIPDLVRRAGFNIHRLRWEL